MDSYSIDRLHEKLVDALYKLDEWNYPNNLSVSQKKEFIAHRIYKQPPSNHSLLYPCVIIEFSGVRSVSADNIRYIAHDRYLITAITKNPYAAEAFRNAILEIPMTSYDRRFISDNLYHDTITINLK